MEVSKESLIKLSQAILADTANMSQMEQHFLEKLIPETYEALLELFKSLENVE